jgi:predicted DNA-binding protein
VAGRNSIEEESMSQPSGGTIRTLAVRLPEDLYTQLTLIASLDGVSMAEIVRDAVEHSIEARRTSGDLAAQAQAALEQVDREAEIRRTALAALLGTAEGKATAPPAKPAGQAQTGRSGGSRARR